MRDIILHYISLAVEMVIREMRKKYTPAGERRFNLNDIGYEIGFPELKGDNFEIDLISDMPKGELISGASPVSFFKRVKKEISGFNFSVEHIKSDTPARGSKAKKWQTIGRDCIMMKSFYKPFDLYLEKDILKEAR
ncbi:MAG: hypothetical protein HY279_12375, partial [Nitrospinae bacterium]|nr:hypothetical protein [Nitrospinota bacterium]